LSVVLDSSAVIALMKAEPGADHVEQSLPEAVILIVNLAEVAAALSANSPEEVRDVIAHIGAAPVMPDEEMAIDAGLLRRMTDRAGLSLGDRFCLALARRLDARVLTADRAWARIAEETGVDIELIR
jgi:ribonuclease VapC